jgi:serine/threonine protein kinase
MTDQPDNDIHLIRRKKKKNIIHEIYRYDQTLVKRFIKIAPFPDIRQVWKLEDAALKRLSGLSVPKTYGFIVNRLNGAQEIIYAREFIDGKPVEGFSVEEMEPLARMMAKIHARGVITRDPSLENFIRTPEGRILFIDFGRAVLLNPKNPVIIDYLGKELARLRCHGLAGDDALYGRFCDFYFKALPGNSVSHGLIDRSSRLWYPRFARKHTS